MLITFFSVTAIAGSFAHDGDVRHVMGFSMKEENTPACGLWRKLEIVEKLGLLDKQIMDLKNADFTFPKQQLESKAQLNLLTWRWKGNFR